jgi:hypothetical protein
MRGLGGKAEEPRAGGQLRSQCLTSGQRTLNISDEGGVEAFILNGRIDEVEANAFERV